MRRATRRRARALATCVLLGGCAVGPNFHEPDAKAPSSFAAAGAAAMEGKPSSNAGEGAPKEDLSRWWQALGDKGLDALVERALHDNPGLEIALTRLQEARTFEVALAGTALPRIEADSGGGRGTGSDMSRSRAAGPLQSADHTSSALSRITQVSGFAGYWDLDLFGKLRREIEAARYDAQAAAAARDAVQTELVAAVVRAYLDLRGLQMQYAVLKRDADAAQSLMDFVQARFDRGITNELDATLARRQLASVRAQLAPLRAQIEAARYAIATLLGRYPEDLRDELERPGLIPELPERIAPGAPLEVLRRRPDVRAAEWELGGATARAGVAAANLFPQLSISGGLGVQGQGLGYTPAASQRIWSLGYAASLPLLDFGTLDALANIADLQTHELYVAYKQTVLRAVQDVDGALANFAAAQERLAGLADAVLASQRAMALASERYDRGLTDFLNVADAQRQEYELEGEYAQAQTAAADGYVAVYRALGGGWESFGEPPPVRAAQPAVIALFRRLVAPGSGQ